MAKTAPLTEILTLRLPPDVARRLAREARRQRRTKSSLALTILTASLTDPAPDPAAEAGRQSLLVRERDSERETVLFVVDAADLRGWE